ncbi:hypothetical protein CPC08DRAFT_783062 [Agrocybe pediades]|nr:hypothetical protein CPC08DRAFT_783062 [Agrocybe pediades]
MSSSTTIVNGIEIFIFAGTHYQEWDDKMTQIFLMNKILSVVLNTFSIAARPGNEPAMPSTANELEWKQYNANYRRWQKQVEDQNRDNLIPSIWETIKDKMAHKAWSDLQKKFEKPQFNETLEYFRRLVAFRFNLLDPTPQLATFLSIYGKIEKIKAGMVSKSMIGLLLLSHLPLNTAVNQPESVYQTVVNYFNNKTKLSMELENLDLLQTQIRMAWLNRFGTLNEQQRPKKGTTIKNSAVASSSKQPAAGPSVQSAEHNSTIKPKTNHPQYIPSQAPFKGTPQGSSAPQQNEKPKHKRTQKGKGKAHANEMNTGIPNEVFMASTAQPSLPAPTRSTVTSTGAWKHLDNRMAPYLAPQAARMLASHLGARPTGPLLGRSSSTTPVPPSSSTTSFDDQMVVDDNAPTLTRDEEVELFGEETAGAEEFTGSAEYYENRAEIELMTPEELVARVWHEAEEAREETAALRWESNYGDADYDDYFVERQGLSDLTPNQHSSRKRRNSVG